MADSTGKRRPKGERVHFLAGSASPPQVANPSADRCGLRLAGLGELSEVAISKLVRQPGIGAVPHGFRSSFRDWAAECSDAPREVCELALAHVNTNAIEAAYRRTDLFGRRRALMEQWAAFLAGSKGEGPGLAGQRQTIALR